MKDKFDRRHKTFKSETLEWIMIQKGLVGQDPLDYLIQQEEQDEIESVIEEQEKIDKARRMKLKNLINKLPKDDRYIIHQYFFKGKTLKEIADDLNFKTPSAVWKRKKKILKKLGVQVDE